MLPVLPDKCERIPRWRLLVLLALLLPCMPAGLRAQTTGSQEVSTRNVEPTFKLQAERNMVTVRVVVRNGKGEAVGNLRQEDFQVFDRGKRQTIGQFSVDKPTTEAIETPAQKSIEKTAPAEPAAGKAPAAITLPRRFVGLYFDDVNTGFSGLVRSRDASYRFLQTSLHPGDRVGVFTASGKNSLDFTDDLDKLHQALADLRPNPIIAPDETCGAITPYEAYYIVVIKGLMSDANDPIERLVGAEKQSCSGLPRNSTPSQDSGSEAQRVKAESDMRAMATLRGLESLARFMSTLPGQRSIVFVSDGFQSQTLGYAITQISERALHANIIINALDARGLYVGGFASDASVAGRDLPQEADVRALKQQVMEEEALRASEAMGTLAQDTGGIFFENNNDLEAGLRRVAGTPETSYTLAFSPENLKHDGAFHGLKVTLVSVKGLNVQARKGYYAPKKSEDLAAQEKEDLQDAVFSQSERQGLPIKVNTQFFMIDASDAEIGVVTHVDLQQIHFRKEADRNVHTLTFVTAVFDRDGHYVAGQQKVLELRLRDASLETFLRTGIKVKSDLKVKPGIYLLRSVVRDSESGQISAVNRTVEIPY
ncbi:MAG: VWA domain-containing protein [Acidobacteriota bacterium]|nr:VWA domain-containing protein [Acidobacteriota bacterium]